MGGFGNLWGSNFNLDLLKSRSDGQTSRSLAIISNVWIVFFKCVCGNCARLFIVSTKKKKIEDNNRIRSSTAEALRGVKSGLTFS